MRGRRSMVLGLSALYAGSSEIQGAESVMGGLQAAALAVIVLSVWGLSKPFKGRLSAWGIAAVSAALVCARPSLEPLIILGFGIWRLFLFQSERGATDVGVQFSQLWLHEISELVVLQYFMPLHIIVVVSFLDLIPVSGSKTKVRRSPSER